MGAYDIITLTITQKSDMSHYAYGCSFSTNKYLISKTVCHLSVGVFSVLITWLVKFGCDSKIWKSSSIEQVCADGLAVGASAFKIQDYC